MRLAKRTQYPNCEQKWGVRLIGVIGQNEIYRCKFCGWMPATDRRELERVRREAQEASRGGAA